MTDSSERRTKHLAKPLTYTHLTEDPNNATLKDVILLAEGEWHDSLTPYPTTYTPQNLSTFTIQDTSGWRTHAFTRGIDEYIGDATNIHYDPTQHAIVTDLVFHLATQASRDTLAAIKHRQTTGRPTYVSIEMETTDHPTPTGMQATNITITGWITTDTPACKRCTIPKHQTSPPDENKGEKRMTDTTTYPNTPAPTPTTTPTAEDHNTLCARITALETTLKTLQDQITATTETNKTLTATLTAATTAAQTAEKRLKALEEQPQHKTPLATPTPDTEPIADYRTDNRN